MIKKSIFYGKNLFRLFEKIDNGAQIRYNRDMERIRLAVIGGGASGLMLANALQDNRNMLIFERGERVGRKLAATGNGQGNLTNVGVLDAEYFSVDGRVPDFAKIAIQDYDNESMVDFFCALGVLTTVDERGRVYPSGRQASALTDALRFSLARKGIPVALKTQVTKLEKAQGGFVLTALCEGVEKKYFAEKVVLCAGGKAAKNFDTDGSAYALAQGVGHSVTKLYPSLVQLKTDTQYTKTLKGIRVNDGMLSVTTPKRSISVQGDIIFTDYGISGDAVFRLSAFIADELGAAECRLSIDFLPEYDEESLYLLLKEKTSILCKA